VVYRVKKQASGDMRALDEEITEDALAAVALLRGTEKIDINKIFVLGHSLGGFALPRIGTRDAGIAGLIVMAGPTRPFEDVILDQYMYIDSLDGTISSDEQNQLDELRRQAAKVKSKGMSKDTAASQW